MSLPVKCTFHQPRPQNFSFPSSIIYTITKFPSSPGGYQKLLKTCKYFYLKSRILALGHLYWEKRGSHGKGCWRHSAFPRHYFIIKHFFQTFWLYKYLIADGTLSTNLITPIIQKLYRCDIYLLSIKNQNISFEEYKVLTNSGTIQMFYFENVTVRYDNSNDDKIVPFEDIIRPIPNVAGVTCIYKDNLEKHFTLKTAQNLVKLPYFPKLNSCRIEGIYESLNIQYFCDFIKKHDANYLLQFSPTVSNSYDQEFRTMLDKNFITFKIPSAHQLRILTNRRYLATTATI